MRYRDMQAHGGTLVPTAGWLTLGTDHSPRTLSDPLRRRRSPGRSRAWTTCSTAGSIRQRPTSASAAITTAIPSISPISTAISCPRYFTRLNEPIYETFDICINIESCQEMSQVHVDHYLRLFDSVTARDGVIYLSNAHDYLFRGTWNNPPHWRKVFCANTPRAWSRDHPTEIFIKSEGDFSRENELLDMAHRFHVHELHATDDPDAFLKRMGYRKWLWLSCVGWQTWSR
jgi:hypothetical protein